MKRNFYTEEISKNRIKEENQNCVHWIIRFSNHKLRISHSNVFSSGIVILFGSTSTDYKCQLLNKVLQPGAGTCVYCILNLNYFCMCLIDLTTTGYRKGTSLIRRLILIHRLRLIHSL